MQVTPGEETEWAFTAEAEDVGARLDVVLARRVPTFSRNRIKDLILTGAVAINGKPVDEPKLKVKAGDELVLVAPEPVDADPEPENIPLDILYEDEHLIVVDKPVGMVVHPAPGSLNGTLVNALLYHCGDSLRGIGGVKRPGIVHRLDKDTSGVMVAAKTDQAHQHLAAQFADHGRTGPLHRAYTAFAWGRTQQARGMVERVVILDLDVHQGNGTAEIFAADPSVFTVSVHGARNFPLRKHPGDLDIGLEDGADDSTYLAAVDVALDGALGSGRADLLLYIAGADPYAGDRLGRLSVSRAGLLERDRRVLAAARSVGLPVGIVCGGGYCADIGAIVEIHAGTMLLAADLLAAEGK